MSNPGSVLRFSRNVFRIVTFYPHSLLSYKRVTTHVIRHTTAVHLKRSGVDINTIRAWLGHVSLDTTHVYAEIDLEMKAKALAKCDVPTSASDNIDNWSNNPELMAFLRSL